MTGPKLNEKQFEAGARNGTRASAKYLRVSASKARVVLDLIRDLPVKRADEVLQFTDREVSNDIRKVLASAVANAVTNDGQEADELYVKACYSDEGPTLKRFAARARGRGTRINKRTCHITIIVDRMDERELDTFQNREARRTAAGRRRGAAATGGSAASRRARVERSRQRAASLKDGEAPKDDDSGEDMSVEAAVQGFAGAVPADGDEAPEGYLVKGNAQSMLYHEPGTRYYDQTKAEYWFESAEAAEAAGFSAPGSTKADDDEAASETEADASDEPQSDAGESEAGGGEGSASDEPQSDAGESEADAKEDN
jgi:large subunit ribosomal protein L22